MTLHERVYSPNYGGALTVVGVQNDEVALSSDGVYWISDWHAGPEADEAVYVERLSAGRRIFHGWVDKASRRIVQSG